MNISLRSSQSSYGDPRYLSAATFSDAHVPSPLGKTLVDGYRDAANPQNEDRARYNPLNPAHPRSSALVNTSDPVTMYLLAETAIGDSSNYEILSFEEVEALKKERSLLSSRIEGTKRKLNLETKLRDAAQSIGRLYSPPSPRSSAEYDTNGKSHRRSRSIFGRSGTAQILDKSDSELAMSQRKCEELAQELWKLEQRSQQISQRLLQHTAGVLQMTHKGLRKTPKNPDAQASDSYDENDFDDRHLYRTPEHLDNYGLHGRIDTNLTASGDSEAMQATEKRLDELSQRMCDMMIQSNPDEFVDPPPQSNDSNDPARTIEAHLAYIESSMNSLASRNVYPNLVGPGTAPEAEGAWRQHLTVINTRVQSIVDRFGLTRSPTLPPPPSATDGEGLEEQLGYLQTGIDGLESRVDGLIEQKSILTTQIQQQRELNSKSDAERDAHIGDLTEQLAHMRRDHEASQREGKAAQDELAVLMEQLDGMRNNGSTQEEAKAAQAQAEGEVARLNSVVDSLQNEVDIRAQEAMEACERADQLSAQLEASAKQSREEADVRVQEAVAEAVQEAIDRRVQVENQLAAAEVQRAEMEAQLGQAEERRAEVESQIAQVEERRIEVEDRFAEVEAQIAEVEGRRIATEERCHEVESQIAQVEERRMEAEERCIEIEAQIAQVEERRIEAEKRCVELESLLMQAEERHAEASHQAAQAEQQALADKLAESEEKRAEAETQLAQVEELRAQAEVNAENAHNEMTNLEGEVVRITTELTMVKAELDGAYGTRAQRAAEVALNPEIQAEIDALNTRNLELAEELAELRGKQGGGDIQRRADTLEKELRETLDDYEAMTKASIEFEKERERFESVVDSLRDRCEQLETQLSEERISWMNLSSPTTMGRDPTMETTSTMVLKNEFKKMMRDTRNENMKILKVRFFPFI
ncbi:hypothetical protein N7490_008891 [Penicillium lividum]|nr:hypothetical protein N7490_008891 [Penicillium lividum]